MCNFTYFCVKVPCRKIKRKQVPGHPTGARPASGFARSTQILNRKILHVKMSLSFTVFNLIMMPNSSGLKLNDQHNVDRIGVVKLLVHFNLLGSKTWANYRDKAEIYYKFEMWQAHATSRRREIRQGFKNCGRH